MNITCVMAKERFDNTEFSNEIFDGRARWLHSTYTCPVCGVKIGFQKRHFERLLRNRQTNLTPEFATCFDESAREHSVDAGHYLDWVCPQCALRVRVYVKFWAGGRHGDFGINLVNVLETAPMSSPLLEP